MKEFKFNIVITSEKEVCVTAKDKGEAVDLIKKAFFLTDIIEFSDNDFCGFEIKEIDTNFGRNNNITSEVSEKKHCENSYSECNDCTMIDDIAKQYLS